ncbi:uncharacterized protein J7T54_006256 [Emericellopsis cladophorae]|uniref:Uncharacterized protein n=1 Tax=Emericellopsis cladophorae TaxID=2686198 RepID=A0A9Q0BHV4_9HYPO|nr:uncharacterized protein J7T54_006256 [Emericellopsis cladophorae]KAI6785917.1 hypothetical protein J7T54_006256 [Emericellopsis cladophorae]
MGQKHSLIEVCEDRGKNLSEESCQISFDGSGNVSSFGGIGTGEFEADPDIAGFGIFIAFMTLSAIVSFAGLCLIILRGVVLRFAPDKRDAKKFVRWYDYSKKAHQLVDNLILSSADAQLFLILAFGGAFYWTSQCTVSLYHYLVAFHMILAGLATFLLAFVMISQPYKEFFSTVARLTIFLICLIAVSNSKDMQRAYLERLQDIQSHLPTSNQRDSFIILPAYCILEQLLDPSEDLGTEERQHLANRGIERSVYPQFVTICTLFGFTTFFTLLGPQIRFFVLPRSIDDCHGPIDALDADEKRGALLDDQIYLGLFYKIVVWIACVAIIIWNWITVAFLRKWIDESEWLNNKGGNAENDVLGIGQLAPLASLGTIGLVLVDIAWDFAKHWHPLRWWTGEDDVFKGPNIWASRVPVELQRYPNSRI